MKQEELEKIIKGYSNEEGQIDWAKVTEAINNDINNVVAKQTDKAKEDARGEFLKTFEVENVEQLAEKINQGQEVQETLTKTQSELTNLQRKEALYSQGITDPDRVDYILFNVNKRVSDDVAFEDAFKAYREEKPDLFKKEPITFGKREGGEEPTTEPGYRKALKERHPDLD
jgi:hypothetical protein